MLCFEHKEICSQLKQDNWGSLVECKGNISYP